MRLILILKEYLKINWYKTIYFNFTLLPFKTAIKFPFLLYGKVKLSGLKGKIIFNTPVKKFMCKFGKNLEIITLKGKSELNVNGTLYVNGSFSFGNDFIVHILKGAEMHIGEGSYFGRKTQIICTNSITLGSYLRFGYESQIIDSNFHYTVDLNTGITNNISKPISIGSYTWIGNRNTIMAGTETNDYLIIGSNSLLNKNYKEGIPSASLIAGIPAKLIKKDFVRVFDSDFEQEIRKYFRKTDIENFNVFDVFEADKNTFIKNIKNE
ncbi:MAG: acyltransferase [Weeksellaceae bacterium]